MGQKFSEGIEGGEKKEVRGGGKGFSVHKGLERGRSLNEIGWMQGSSEGEIWAGTKKKKKVPIKGEHLKRRGRTRWGAVRGFVVKPKNTSNGGKENRQMGGGGHMGRVFEKMGSLSGGSQKKKM